MQIILILKIRLGNSQRTNPTSQRTKRMTEWTKRRRVALITIQRQTRTNEEKKISTALRFIMNARNIYSIKYDTCHNSHFHFHFSHFNSFQDSLTQLIPYYNLSYATARANSPSTKTDPSPHIVVDSNSYYSTKQSTIQSVGILYTTTCPILSSSPFKRFRSIIIKEKPTLIKKRTEKKMKMKIIVRIIWKDKQKFCFVCVWLDCFVLLVFSFLYFGGFITNKPTHPFKCFFVIRNKIKKKN